jgi:primosomal protein N' (replication factor Y) (superfamily II helicase)
LGVTAESPDQLELVSMPGRRRRRSSGAEPVADDLPVAQVQLDVGLPHLDRTFDYAVPASMDADAVVGARVAVRFAGTDHAGFIVGRVAESDHTGRLAPLRRVVSAEPVLAPQIAAVARAVADRYAGTVADVLRLAVPPRHARVEGQPSPEALTPPPRPEPGGWAHHEAGAALVDALAAGRAARAVWNPPAGAQWPDLIARLVLSSLSGGRGALVVVPDARDVERVDAALTSLVGSGQHVVLTAELGPAERYRRWLAVRRGSVRAVVGTRSAMFAPVERLGLVVIWDDGDDLHAELRAPYPHAREVLLLRAHGEGAGAVVGGFARTAEAAQLVATGWAKEVMPSRAGVRTAAPRIRVAGDDVEQHRDEAARSARLPSLAWRTVKAGLQHGPVLVQVARSGYVPGLACARCRHAARCTACGGPMMLAERSGGPTCRWCGTAGWSCDQCGGANVRARSVGTLRTAEELGRAFPEVPVQMSQGGGVVSEVTDRPALVVATPGAEPVAVNGYAAALLLDGDALLSRASLRAGEEALRRWLGAAALVRPATDGGEVVIVAESGARPVQALVRWDPAGHAEHELTDRSSLGFPPVRRIAELSGAPADVADLVGLLELPPSVDVLGPVRDGESDRVILRASRADGLAMAAAVRAASGVRSARRSGDVVRARIDPVDLG